MSKECQLQLKAEIERVLTNPTDEEREWDSEEIADEILKGLGVDGEGQKRRGSN
jgi:hypothetical protein